MSDNTLANVQRVEGVPCGGIILYPRRFRMNYAGFYQVPAKFKMVDSSAEQEVISVARSGNGALSENIFNRLGIFIGIPTKQPLPRLYYEGELLFSSWGRKKQSLDDTTILSSPTSLYKGTMETFLQKRKVSMGIIIGKRQGSRE